MNRPTVGRPNVCILKWLSYGKIGLIPEIVFDGISDVLYSKGCTCPTLWWCGDESFLCAGAAAGVSCIHNAFSAAVASLLSVVTPASVCISASRSIPANSAVCRGERNTYSASRLITLLMNWQLIMKQMLKACIREAAFDYRDFYF